ncbi:farnesyl diphosphate synthase 2-like [Rutidosis leptorrhynchoides]|uniref:farnesyl diphosphate synthase 2-like n=1 Tax=Rutidosis leptorrhynchoides TaxID=125765 RepID=UPI003A98F3E3
MIDYNVPGGKGNRILSLVDTYKLLKGEELTDDEMFLACALGWCAEWLHASVLVTDDIVDNSDLRRDQPCWYRLPEVGLVAVNDAIILRNHVAIILKKYFKGKAYYVDLLELFSEIEYQCYSGQMIDMITTIGEKNLSKFSLSTNLRILQYKTSYLSFYLPVACALLMAGENLTDHIHVKDVLVKMGIYFSVQDDYLDAYGDPKVTGKTGVDIENFKYSWLIAKALELANEEQEKILNENYGIKNPVKIAKVKELYDILNIQGVYEDYENKTYEELIRLIEANPSLAIQKALKSFLGKIYKRQK